MPPLGVEPTPKSPLLSSIVFIIFAFFSVSGYVYGRVAGTVRGYKDVPVMMGAALKDMTSFLVLAFVLGQFIALFNWSGIGSWIAVSGATALENAGVTGFPVIIGFILLCSLLNLFIISGSGRRASPPTSLTLASMSCLIPRREV